jgi:hypothetical protein
MSGKWPWPGDTPVERARRIANSLLTLLPGDEQPLWMARAHGYGETWLGSSLVRWTADDVVTTAEAADMVHVLPATIRRWHSDGELPNRGRGRYRVGDVLDASAARRQRRAKRAG